MVMLAGKIFIAGIDLHLRGMNDWTTDSLPVQNLYMKYPLWISLVSCVLYINCFEIEPSGDGFSLYNKSNCYESDIFSFRLLPDKTPKLGVNPL